MRMLKGFFLPILLFSTTSYAFFCPTNFSQINTGSSMEEVMRTCGPPDSQDTQVMPPEGPQEWTYFVPQAVALSTDALAPQKGTLKTQITFDSSGKAINISVNGIGVGASNICGPNTNIALNDSRDKVKATCGDPSFINKQNGSTKALGPVPPPVKITTFIYKTTPPVTLIFQNGRLVERK